MWHLNRVSDSRRVKEEGRVTVPRDRGLDLPAVIGEIERSNKTLQRGKHPKSVN